MDDFALEVINLYNDDSRLKRLSRKGCDLVEAHFSLSSTVEVMNKVLTRSREDAQMRLKTSSGISEYDPIYMAGEAKIKRLESRVCELEKELLERNRKIEEIHSSTSWKVSSPIRWIKSRLTGAKTPSSS